MKRSHHIWAPLFLAMAWLSSGCGGTVPPVAPTPTPVLTPSISSLSPSSVLQPCFLCGPPQPITLTVNGSNFLAESTVNWKGSPRPTSFVNNTQLTAVISGADLFSAIGAVPITVTNPPNLISNTANLTILANP